MGSPRFGPAASAAGTIEQATKVAQHAPINETAQRFANVPSEAQRPCFEVFKVLPFMLGVDGILQNERIELQAQGARPGDCFDRLTSLVKVEDGFVKPELRTVGL